MKQHPVAPESTVSLNGHSKGEPVFADRSQLQQMWQEHRRWIAAVLLAHKPRSADLEDLLQEVAMTLVAKIHTLRDENNLRGWLRTIALNVARAAGRLEQSRQVTAMEHSDIDACTPHNGHDRTLESAEHSQRVMQCVAQLPADYREPLMLKAVWGMRTRQIARMLGIEEATVDTRISRARKMLRERLQDETQMIDRHNSEVYP